MFKNTVRRTPRKMKDASSGDCMNSQFDVPFCHGLILQVALELPIDVSRCWLVTSEEPPGWPKGLVLNWNRICALLSHLVSTISEPECPSSLRF